MKILRNILSAFTCLLLFSACSTTEHLLEGEQLYTGISHINYTDKGKKVTHEANNPAGVILSIAEAAEKTKQLLLGKGENAVGTLTDTISADDEDNISHQPTSEDLAELNNATEELEAVLAYAPNNALFGSSFHRTPWPIGLWAYNHYYNASSKWGKWMFKSFATDPILITNVNPDTRVKVATNTLRNFGFFRGKVTYNLVPYGKDNRKAKIDYNVHSGRVFRLDTISYMNYPPAVDSLLRKTMRESLLHSGDAFNVNNLTGEQSRIEKLLRNEGYYYFKAAQTTYKADTLAKPYQVQLRVMPQSRFSQRASKRYYMGKTYINILNHEGETLDNSLSLRTNFYHFAGEKIPVRPLVWLKNIQHRMGQLYRQDDQEATQQKLSALGIFSQLNVNYMPQDTTALCDTLDLYINATLDQPYTTDLEMNVTTKNSDRIGPGLSFSVQRKNAFRGAELLNFKLYGSYEWHTGHEQANTNSLFNSYEVGSSFSVDFGHIVFPGISRRRFRFPTSTSFSLNADWLNRAQYFNLFSLGLKATYAWHKNETVRHEFTPLSLTYDKLLRSNSEFQEIMEQNPALYVSMRDRFVPSMQYTVTYQSAPTHRNPLWFEASVKEAGNITSGIYAIAGKPFNEKDKNLFENPFAQYLKFTAELHNNFRLSHDQSLVTRLSAGLIWSYGNSTVAPYSDQFFVGGANSIRAFTIRTIGPGHYAPSDSKYSYMDQTGNFKLEANVEYRFPVFGSLQGALFLDAGNVWLMRADEQRPGGKLDGATFLKDIALGTGAGLRYNLDFLVLRLDLGVALHNPGRNDRSSYYNVGKFKNSMALNFAIGYPF